MGTARIYEFTTILDGGDVAASVEAPPRAPLPVGPPPEFAGTDDVWSPEHLLLGAVSACLWATVRAMATRRGIAIRRCGCRTVGKVEKGAKGLVFTAIRLEVELEITGASDAVGRALVEDAHRRCIVSNSLVVPVSLQIDVTGDAEFAPPPEVTAEVAPAPARS